MPPAEGAEVPGPVLGDAVGEGEAGVGLVREADEGVALVVLQEDVVAGHVPLDEGVLQHQGLELALDEDGVEVVHLGHHGPGLLRVGRGLLEVLAHPVAELLGLAHVDDLTGLIHHQVDPRLQRQGVGLLPQFRACHSVSSFLRGNEKGRLPAGAALSNGSLIRRSCSGPAPPGPERLPSRRCRRQ